MKKKIEKIVNSKLFLSFLIILLISLSVGAGTYAWFTWTSSDNPTVTLSIGNLADVIFTSGPDININNLSPVFYYDEGVSTTFSIKNNNSTHSYLLYNVKINIEEIDPTLSSQSFKYALTSGDMFLTEGSFDGLGDGDYVDVITSSMPEGTSNYTLYFYLDSNIENDTSIMTKEFKGSIEVSSPDPIGNVATIANLFTPGSTVLNNNISYNVDTTHKLIKDTLGNIRYYGADPDNYINFNCETYPDTNCETWRIIGIVNGKLKIMRNESIGEYSWDTSVSTVNSGYGINQWGESVYNNGSIYQGADLMKLLNPGYESNQDLNDVGGTITVNNSLYYNSGSGTCYNGQSNATTTCDFTSTGIKNSVTRNKIEQNNYYTGGWKTSGVYPNEILAYEREISENYNDITRKTTWIGKIAIPSASDYAYAVDLSQCNKQISAYYNDSSCKANNWLLNILINTIDVRAWLLTTNPKFASTGFDVGTNGRVLQTGRVGAAFDVVPVLYISSNDIITGSGTSSNPYKFSV